MTSKSIYPRGGSKQTNRALFIEASIEKYGDRFHYSESIPERFKREDSVELHCKIHNTTFTCNVRSHFNSNHGCCRECANDSLREARKSDVSDVISKMVEARGNLYDYSEVTEHTYKNYHTKVPITCPYHGRWMTTPANFIKNKSCPECNVDVMSNHFRKSFEDYVAEAKDLHDSKYQYRNPEDYKNGKSKIRVHCPDHGGFKINADNHIRNKGSGCPACNQNIRMDDETPLTIYLISFKRKGVWYKKIGVTMTSVEKRFQLDIGGWEDFQIEKEFKTNRSTGFQVESKFLRELKECSDYRKVDEMRDFSGWTEMFDYHLLDNERIISRINELLII